MKKILVVLLILAVTTGAFAQWTIGASGKLATRLTFTQERNGTTAPSAGLYGESIATADLGYTRGVFTGAFQIRTSGFNGDNDWQPARLRLAATINGGNYFFTAQTRLNTLITGEAVNSSTTQLNQINRFFGWYKLVNGIIHLEASFADWSGVTWMADNAVDRNLADKIRDKTGSKYLLANVVLPVGFEFGLYVNRLFQFHAANKDGGWTGGDAYNGAPIALIDGRESLFNSLVIGTKFNISPFVVAAQFSTRHYNTYFGATGTFGPISAGVSFWGAFPDQQSAIRVGGNVGFNGGFFGVGAKVVLGIYGSTISGTLDSIDYYGDTANESTLAIEPNIWINAIPAYLKFTLNAGFYFTTPRGAELADVTWKINPEATWNFLGTGAGSWNTGFYLGYTFKSAIGADPENYLKLGFSWSM